MACSRFELRTVLCAMCEHSVLPLLPDSGNRPPCPADNLLYDAVFNQAAAGSTCCFLGPLSSSWALIAVATHKTRRVES
jgi:hypothetical protein